MNSVDVVCAGLCVVNFPVFPVDETLFSRDLTSVGNMELLTGGDAANQAKIISRMGFKTAICSRRGRDRFGDILMQLFEEDAGVSTDGIVVDPSEATSVCAMMIKPDGNRHFCSHKGCINNFCFEDINLEMLSSAKVASIGGVYGLPKFDGNGAAAFFEFAKTHGAVTVADTKFDQRKIGLKGIRGMLRHTDHFFPSYDEASAISGKTQPEDIADVLLEAGADFVGIKLGAKGCYIKSGTAGKYIPAIAGEVVDTTGAGDNFMSGFIAGLLKGWDIEKCCLFGTAAASLCVSQLEPTSAVRSFRQVKDRLEAAL